VATYAGASSEHPETASPVVLLLREVAAVAYSTAHPSETSYMVGTAFLASWEASHVDAHGVPVRREPQPGAARMAETVAPRDSPIVGELDYSLNIKAPKKIGNPRYELNKRCVIWI
jgi:hypothetical protein